MWHRGYVRSPACASEDGTRQPGGLVPAGCGCRCGRRIAYQAITKLSRQRQSGATGFKYGFKKLWDTPPYSIV